MSPASPQTALPPLLIGLAEAPVESGPLLRRIRDVNGSYTIPYVQSPPDLTVGCNYAAGPAIALDLELCAPGRPVEARGRLEPARPSHTFAGLAPAEYTLRAHAAGCPGPVEISRIGVGLVVAAIGDSLTEGYWSRGYARGADLDAGQFPPESVSRDGRNFPQHSPTTHRHSPGTTCFESWMTDLNNRLSDALGHPVFIANEGWGGATTASYLEMMRADPGWGGRIRDLAPSLWLIHLGVNDERGKIAPAAFAAGLASIIRSLVDDYGASPPRILVARPSYDYWPGAPELLASYVAEIDRLRSELGVRAGPDFYAAFARDKDRWYGADPVHPNVAGMRYMAELWGATILEAMGAGAPAGQPARVRV